MGILLFPAIRVIVFALSRNGLLTGAFIFDYVAAGSAIALFLETSMWKSGQRALATVLESRTAPLLFLLALVSHAMFAGTTRWLFAIDMIAITPIEAVILAIFVAWAVRNPQTWTGRALNTRALRIVGVGSYSLYLWQQLFFGPGAAFALTWPVSVKLAAACSCAILSFFLIERPSLRLRARLEHAMFDSVATTG